DGTSILPRGAIQAASCLTSIDLSDLDPTTRTARMQTHAVEAGGRLSPETAHMLEAVWFRWSAGGRLLLVLPHLAVDGVPWRILVPDLATAYAESARGRTPTLEATSTPFRIWAQHLAADAVSPERHAEIPTWNAIVAEFPPLLPDVRLDPRLDTVAG